MKITPMLFFLFLLIFGADCFSQIITDPKQDFFTKIDVVVGDEYCKLEADFNNDGLIDVAYSANSLKNEFVIGEEYAWIIYVKTTGGFQHLGYKDAEKIDPIIFLSFSKNRYWIGLIPELNAFGLLTMSEGAIKYKGEPKGQLKALLFDADGVRTVNVGSETTDIESLKRRFPKILTPPVQPVTP